MTQFSTRSIRKGRAMADLKSFLTKDMAKKKPVVAPVKLDPIPAKYAGMPQDVARAMMASDKNNVLAGAKKAMDAGTVRGKGNIQQSTSKPSTKGGAGYIGVGGKKS